MALSLIDSFQWEVPQMDVRPTFLNGDLLEEIFLLLMALLHLFESKKALNDLKKVLTA